MPMGAVERSKDHIAKESREQSVEGKEQRAKGKENVFFRDIIL